MSDSIRPDESVRPEDASERYGNDDSPRREFMKAIVTAVAGLTLAGPATEAQTRQEAVKKKLPATVGAAMQRRLAESLQAYRNALRGQDPEAVRAFFAPKVDFRSASGIVREWSGVEKELADGSLLRRRADAFITHVKWLSPTLALVDGNFDYGDGRGWFTEIWQGAEKFRIEATRLRAGKTDAGFEALNALEAGTVAGDVPEAIARREEASLRKSFKVFRAAFNSADVKAVTALTTETVDAIPVFSFLEGRAQILTGQAAVGAKAERMLGQEVINPSPEIAVRTAAPAANRAMYVAGEPKLVRFLSPTLALVDGTAEINNIPSAHEFSPKSMRGLYSTVWTKAGNQWKAEATRPWF